MFPFAGVVNEESNVEAPLSFDFPRLKRGPSLAGPVSALRPTRRTNGIKERDPLRQRILTEISAHAHGYRDTIPASTPTRAMLCPPRKHPTPPVAAWYLQILMIHVGCVIASGSLFFIRGCMMLAGWPVANHIALRRISVVVDVLLLAAAIALTTIIHQYPFVQAWLTVKVLLLVVYIALGVYALRSGRTRAIRAVCFGAAMLVFLFIVTVARAHNAWGALLYL